MTSYPYSGVDVSYAQGAYTPPGNINFVIVNASRANVGLVVGSYYHYQVDRARQAGKEIGHYFFNGNISPTQCANFFLDNLYDFRKGDMIWLDSESEGGTGTVAWGPGQANEFAAVVLQRLGFVGGVYLNQSLMNGYDWASTVAMGVLLWLAWYNDSLPGINHWGEAAQWQYTSNPIDTNRAAYTQAQMSGGGGSSPKTRGKAMAFEMMHRPTTGEICFVDEYGGENIIVYKSADIGIGELIDACNAVFGNYLSVSDRQFDIAAAIASRRRTALGINAAKGAGVDVAALSASVSSSVIASIQKTGVSVDTDDLASDVTKAVEAALVDQFSAIPAAVMKEFGKVVSNG